MTFSPGRRVMMSMVCSLKPPVRPGGRARCDQDRRAEVGTEVLEVTHRSAANYPKRVIEGIRPRPDTGRVKPSPSSSVRRASRDEALELWREYKRTGDVRARNRLVMTFAPLVKYIVFKKVRELPARCDLEDFLSCGLEALIASIDRYDPSKGATLEQFAWTRIHGAVLDELRRQDWAPRSLRRWERDIRRVREQFTTLHGRRPSHDELAESLAITPGELRRRQDDIALSDVTSLNALVIQDDETPTVERIDMIANGDERMDPEHASATAEAKARFRRAFDALPQREREIAVLLYVKELTLREIGDILGVSESRVCQIHSQLKRKLKHELADDTQLFAAVA
jgi:RNA polymerase sigma factor for flagellar operon FliA